MAEIQDASFSMDWVTRVPVTRADYYNPDRPQTMGTIRALGLTRASVHTDQVTAGRVTLSLGCADGDPYGLEVDFTPDACLRLASLLEEAARGAAGRGPHDCKLGGTARQDR